VMVNTRKTSGMAPSTDKLEVEAILSCGKVPQCRMLVYLKHE
jgi:hypothetical protein